MSNGLQLAISLLQQAADELDNTAPIDEYGDPPTPDEALARTLAGRGDRSCAQLLGVPATGGRLIVVRLDSEPSRDDAARLVSRNSRLVSAKPAPHLLVVVVPAHPGTAGVDNALKHSDRLLVDLERNLHQPWRVGISGGLRGFEDLLPAYRDAVDAALLARKLDVASVRADADWGPLTVERLRRVMADRAPVGNPLDRLFEYDERNRTQFCQTLHVWLEHNNDTGRAAELLHIHPNTLRYRLRRAAELASIDLSDPTHRLACMVLLESRMGS